MVNAKAKVSYPIDFFKVYLSKFCSRQLSLPPAFAAEVSGSIPCNATLKDPDEKEWHVKLQKDEDDLIIIEDGWQEFANHHSLVDGDFLIFKYDGRSHFDVVLYSKNGLKKKKALASVEKHSIRVKEENVEEAGKIISLPSRSCKRKYSEISAEAGKHEQSKHDFQARMQFIQRPSSSCPPRVVEAACKFTSTNPFFTVVLRSSHMETSKDLSVPLRFFTEHMEPSVENLRLQVGNRLWTVKFARYPKYSQAKLAAGWGAFARDNTLKSETFVCLS